MITHGKSLCDEKEEFVWSFFFFEVYNLLHRARWQSVFVRSLESVYLSYVRIR